MMRARNNKFDYLSLYRYH